MLSFLYYSLYAISYCDPLCLMARNYNKEESSIQPKVVMRYLSAIMMELSRHGKTFEDKVQEKERKDFSIIINAVLLNMDEFDSQTKLPRMPELDNFLSKPFNIKDIDSIVEIGIGLSHEDAFTRKGTSPVMYPDDKFVNDFYYKYISANVFPDAEKAMRELGVPEYEVLEKLKSPGIKTAIKDGQRRVNNELLQQFYREARAGDMGALKTVTSYIAKDLQKRQEESNDEYLSGGHESYEVPEYVLKEMA